MKKYLPALLLLMAPALSPLLRAAPATVLYDGKDSPPAGLSIAPWGAGSGLEDTAVYLFGGHSLKMTTLDFYQGARITFAAPVPLNVGEAGRVFQITLRRGAAVLHYDPRTVPGATSGGAASGRRGYGQPGGNSPGETGGYPGGGYPGASSDGQPGGNYPGGGYPGGNYPGGGSPGGMPGMGYPGGPGGSPGGGGRRGGGRRRRTNPDGTPAAAAAAAPLIPPVTNLRLVFTLADGRQADILRPIPETSDPALGEGWFSVNVPISMLKLPAGGDAVLKALTVGGDHYGVFYVGRMQIATDTAPLTASIDGASTTPANVPLPLSARADGGFSTLRYSWDFGTGTDTGTGIAVSPRFPEAGQDYTVTLTVSDADGLKAPVTATKKITVKEEAPQFQPGQTGGYPGQPGGYPGGMPGNYPGAQPGGQPGNMPGQPPQGNDPRDPRNE